MKNYLWLPLFAGAIPITTIFQIDGSSNFLLAIDLIAFNGSVFEKCLPYFSDVAWLSKALVTLLLLAVVVRWFFYRKAQREKEESDGEEAQEASPLAETQVPQVEKKAESLEKSVKDSEWQRFREMMFSSYPQLEDTLNASHEKLSLTEVNIACLIYIEISEKDICTFLNIDQDTLAMHRLHLRKCLNIPANQSLEYYIQQKK